MHLLRQNASSHCTCPPRATPLPAGCTQAGRPPCPPTHPPCLPTLTVRTRPLRHPAPLLCSLADSRAAQLKAKHDATLQRLVRATLGLPGGGMTVIPSWDAAAAALQAAGAKPLSPGTDVGGKPADGLEPLAPDPQDAAARAARGGSGNWTAATGAVRSPLQATPPGMPGATPPLLDSSPGGFLDVLNAQIYSPELDVAPPPAAAAALPLAAPPQQPAVTGLPLPPVKQEPAAAAAVASPQQAAPASGGYAVVHTARVVVDGKVMGGGAPLVLGVGQVRGALGRRRWLGRLRLGAWPLGGGGRLGA